ncbi:hypothetical protein ACFOSV_02655 [Algoriphagus namhaensis]|uniref:Outer membrane protein beta-barrel domain-containing protein n=1 Tax=Algoriphagus namhaensis TaxID=915353 RepID=A0ABV8AN51_9BACT
MKKLLLSFFCLVLAQAAFAQESTAQGSTNIYTMSTGETILSFGIVDAEPLNTGTVARFTPFFNFGQQLHFDFSPSFGIYTGLNVRNVGMITDLNDSVRVKQRTYNLGLPIAFKIGDVEGWRFSAGFEAEIAFAYKQKVYVNGEKRKSSSWFDDRVEIFQPSVFAEIVGKDGNFIRFKYYLNDFLTANQQINVPGVEYNPTRSSMFYVSIGYAIKNKNIKSSF